MWATQAGPGTEQYFFHGDPFITSDVIVVGADAASGGAIHAFDRSSGRQRWKFPAGRGVFGPIAGSGRSAFAATPDALVSIDIDSGALRWSRPILVPGFEGPAASADRIFAGAEDGFLYAVNAETGRDEWRTSLGAPATSSVTATETAVYVGAADGRFYCIDPRTGAVLKSLKLDEKLKPRSVPVVAGDAVLVLLTDEAVDYRALIALDLKLDRIRWRLAALKNWSTTRAFVWNKAVVLGTPSGEVVSYNPADASLVWSRSVTGSVRSIGGTEDTLFVSTRQGRLYALRQ
jgi:outer membrane protein assembly factor BamB